MSYDLKNKKVSILGAGRSGMGAAKEVMKSGGIPFISDHGKIEEKTLKVLNDKKISFESGGHSERALDADLMILSPGVKADSEIVQKAKSKGVTVWPEIELAYRICRGKIIGVTGSNGKTTTTTLIGEILKNSGLSTFVCGNIGNPFIGVAGEIPPDGYAVVELSSFQLETIEAFTPHIAMILNITPDHLDRHGSLDNYAGTKLRIFENQNNSDFSIINFDDEYLRKRCNNLKSRTTWISVQSSEAQIYADPKGVLFVDGSELMQTKEIKLRGIHNLYNVCAAVAAAVAIGIDKKTIIDTLKTFAGVEHRLEFVRLIGGVSFINDSKGTNVDSVYWALRAVSAPVILIAGGRDKAGDFSRLNDLVESKVKKVILIGEAAPKIHAAWDRLADCVDAPGMREAVSMAYQSADVGDTVLLSPACASFDMYKNYEERGKDFKDAVRGLK